MKPPAAFAFLLLFLPGLATAQARVDKAPPLLHPPMADLYRDNVAKLAEALKHPESRPEATETVRGLIDEIAADPGGRGPENRTEAEPGGDTVRRHQR